MPPKSRSLETGIFLALVTSIIEVTIITVRFTSGKNIQFEEPPTMTDRMQAISQGELGGPEVLKIVTLPMPKPGIGEIPETAACKYENFETG